MPDQPWSRWSTVTFDWKAQVAEAERYPFEQPAGSYLFADGAARELPPDTDLSGRLPVLAIGANAAPERLLRKFGARAGPIPVVGTLLFDHVVVHAAHFSTYGALPATLLEHEDARTAVFATWLTQDQLRIMDLSEGVGIRYDRIGIAGATSLPTTEVFAYVSRNGALVLEGEPIRLAAIDAAGTSLPAATQVEVLGRVHRLLEAGIGYQAFMRRIVSCFGYRHHMSRRLRETAIGTQAGQSLRSPGAPR